jgi:hypothetical protein
MKRNLSLLGVAAAAALSLAVPAADAAVHIGLQQDAGPIVTVDVDPTGLGFFLGDFEEFEDIGMHEGSTRSHEAIGGCGTARDVVEA